MVNGLSIKPRTIPLLNGEAWIVFDYEKGFYRVAYYFIRTDKNGQRKRYAVSKPKLYDALREVFRINYNPFLGKHAEMASQLECYIRETPWGENLP